MFWLLQCHIFVEVIYRSSCAGQARFSEVHVRPWNLVRQQPPASNDWTAVFTWFLEFLVFEIAWQDSQIVPTSCPQPTPLHLGTNSLYLDVLAWKATWSRELLCFQQDHMSDCMMASRLPTTPVPACTTELSPIKCVHEASQQQNRSYGETQSSIQGIAAY
eukprot:GHUV01039670.1.p1 GENE.GHUV01039670.1~~GHUV01039670.1.p1  ORF type:complete len:161 (-),score=12.28 GHUV01039670.1:15-497(-)